MRLRSAPLSEPPRTVAFECGAASIDVAESEGCELPRPRTRGWPIPRIDHSESQKRGTSLSAADSASNTRTRQGTRFPESRQGMHLAESRQGTWRTRVAACRSWLLDARAGQGSALVLEVAPLLRGA